MESLLILLAIVGLEAVAAWVKKRSARHNVPEDLPDDDRETFDSDADPEASSEEVSDAPPSLQDLIRKFREEQAKLDGEGLPEEESLQEEEELPEEDVLEIPEEKPEPQGAIPQNEPLAAKWNAEPPAEPVPAVRTEMLVEDGLTAPQKIQTNFNPGLEFNRREAAKGILWAKVLEDPRYKRRSPFPFTVVRR